MVEENDADFKLKLSRAIEVPVLIPSPTGKNYFPFQKAGILYGSLSENVLFADEMGLGKTIQAIGLMNFFKDKSAFIVCPASLVLNWEKELKEWLLEEASIGILTSNNWREIKNCDIIIASFSYMSKEETVKEIVNPKEKRFKYLIIDECHYLKNPKSKRTKHILARNGLRSRVERIAAITGTPIVNKPIELYPTIKALCPKAIDNMTYFAYGLKYCGGYKGNFGWNFDGASNLSELGKRLRSNFMVRRKKDQVLKELPEKMVSLAYLPLDKEFKGEIDKYKDISEDKLHLKMTDKVGFEELSEHRRELGVLKVKNATKYIETQLNSGHKKIIVFAHHKEVIAALEENLAPFNVVSIKGSTPKAQRQKAVEMFQGNTDCRVFLGSINAAGVGLTLTAASYVIFVEPSWVPGENYQAIDRAHRIGQKNFVLAEFLVHKGSLDERVLKTMLKKQKNIDEILDGN